MKQNVKEYIKHLIETHHVSSDMHDGVAVYFIEATAEDEVDVTIMTEYSHSIQGTIYCNYVINLDETTVTQVAAPFTPSEKDTKQIRDVREILLHCSNKIIYQELIARKNGFLRAFNTTHTKN